MTSQKPRRSTSHHRNERAALVGLFNDTSRHFDPEHSLDELAGLAAAAGATVVLRLMQERPRPDPATFLGSGKVKSLAAACDELDADVVDATLGSVLKYHEDLQRVRDHGLQQLLAEAREAAARAG